MSIGSGIVVGGVLVATLIVAAGFAVATKKSGHTPLHVGCRHHNHGPKWHADHGRSLEGSRGGRIRAISPDGAELARRSITAGRRGSATPGGGE